MTPPPTPSPAILIIKHGALGDFFQSFPSFDAVRKACPMAHITLLCDPSLKRIAEISPYFDEILTDSRQRPGLSLAKWRWLKKLVAKIARYDLVIDLQQSLRSRLYLLFSKQCDFRFFLEHLKKKKQCHAFLRQKRLLEALHIPAPEPQKPDWLIEAGRELLPSAESGDSPYVILVTETGKKQIQKSWPLQNFIQLAFLLKKAGFQPVLTGLSAASDASQKRLSKLGICDLRGKTEIEDLAKLMRQAALTIGADTGMMHLASLCSCPTLILFSDFSDPRFHSPVPLKAGNVTILQARDTASISFQKVFKTALHLLKKLS